jgi:hypothetical protein
MDYIGELLSMQLSTVHNEIISKLGTCGTVLNLKADPNKCLDSVEVFCWLDTATNIFKEKSKFKLKITHALMILLRFFLP